MTARPPLPSCSRSGRDGGPCRGPSALLVLVLAFCGPAAATSELESLAAPEPLPTEGAVIPGTVLVETFERYPPGRLPPLGGWTSSYDPIFTVDPEGIRGRSARHLSDGFGEFVTDVLVSPAFGPSPGPVAVTVARSAGAGRHQIAPVDLAAERVLTRIELAPGRRILVAQLGAQGVVFVDTGRVWTPNGPQRIGVETNDAGRLRVFLDGEVVFVGTDLVQAATGAPGRIDLLTFLANNADAGTRLLIDDIGPDPEGLPPEPSAVEIPALGPRSLGALAALLSFVAALELRRRRRPGARLHG